MYTQQIIFDYKKPRADQETIHDLIEWFLSALRMNGQTQGREWSLYQQNHHCYSAIVMTPEKDSLNECYANQHVKDNIEKLAAHLTNYTVITLGKELDSSHACSCQNCSGYIFYTTYTLLESMVRCADCFNPIPLYTLPTPRDNEYYDFICWQSDYQSCDRLQMGCTTLERATTKEMSQLNSNLSKKGLACCKMLAEKTQRPVYYYLYQESINNTKTIEETLNKKCPNCNGDWLLKEDWHDFFAYRCDQCLLLSNYPWNLQEARHIP